MTIHFSVQGLLFFNSLFSGLIGVQWGDYNYDYDENSLQNSRRFDFSPMRYRFIRLQWNEMDKSAEYTLKFNGTKRGLWIGTEPPRGRRQ